MLKSTHTVESKEDNIYYNLNLVNNSHETVPLQFSTTLSADIVPNNENYYFSVIRFNLDGAALPIFIFKNNTYYVTLEYNGFVASQVVIYASTSTVPLNNFVYSYQAFIEMINTAYASAFTALGLLTTLPVGAVAPYMVYDTTNNLISMYAQISYYDRTLTTPIKIWMNDYLYFFFDNFRTLFNGVNNADFRDFQILVYNIGNGQNTQTLNPSIPTGYYKMTQEYQALFHWWDPLRISFKSNIMGLRSEYTSIQNTVSNEISVAGGSGSGIPSITQLTDFIPAFDSGNASGWRSNLVYLPTSQYRLLDLIGVGSRNIDLNVVWFDKQNIEHQFYLAPNRTATVKMLFVKKSLFKNFIKNLKENEH